MEDNSLESVEGPYSREFTGSSLSSLYLLQTNAGLEELTEESFTYHACPHLGLVDDPETWMLTPKGRNHCHTNTQPIKTHYQADFCLAESHIDCKVSIAPEQFAETLPDDIRGAALPAPRSPLDLRFARMRLLGVLSGIMMAVLILLVWARPDELPLPVTLPLPTTVSVAEASPLPAISLMALVAPGALLRTGPGMQYEAINTNQEMMYVLILGRDSSEEWILIRDSSGQKGWADEALVDPYGDISGIPVILEEVAVSETAGLAITGDSLPSDSQPEEFYIILAYNSADTSCVSDMRYEATIKIVNNRITINREGLRLFGSYDPRTGSFDVSETHSHGVEYLQGTITSNEISIVIDAEDHFRHYEEHHCDPLWWVSGQATRTGE